MHEPYVHQSHAGQRVAAGHHLHEALVSGQDDPEAGANRQPSYLAKAREVPAEGV